MMGQHVRIHVPIAQANRYDVLRIPHPTKRLQMTPTTPVGMFSSADFLLLKPMALIRVVEYVMVKPVDMVDCVILVGKCMFEATARTDQ